MMIAMMIVPMQLLGKGMMTIPWSPNTNVVMMMNEVSEVATTEDAALTPITPRVAAVAAALHPRRSGGNPPLKNLSVPSAWVA